METADVAEALGYLAGGGYVSNGEAAGSTARAYVWSELRKKTGVHAAYFRGAAPLVAFAGAGDEREVAAVQRRLWNYGRVPLLIAVGDDEVGVYSCYAKPTSQATAGAARLARARDSGRLASDFAPFSRPKIDAGGATTGQLERCRVASAAA